MQQLEMLEKTDKLKCSDCKEIKDEEAFSLHRAFKRGRSYTCKDCQKAYKRQHYLKNKEDYSNKHKNRRRNSSKHKANAAVTYAIKTGKLTIHRYCQDRLRPPRS